MTPLQEIRTSGCDFQPCRCNERETKKKSKIKIKWHHRWWDSFLSGTHGRKTVTKVTHDTSHWEHSDKNEVMTWACSFQFLTQEKSNQYLVEGWGIHRGGGIKGGATAHQEKHPFKSDRKHDFRHQGLPANMFVVETAAEATQTRIPAGVWLLCVAKLSLPPYGLQTVGGEKN